jgi:shikimate kinase
MNSTGPIVIVGFMGCGKTEVARALARRHGLPMADLDEMIARQHGRTAAQLIREDGEAAFRSIETKVLHELLETGTRGVIALGGGAWITEVNRRLIGEYRCVSVWIDTSFDLCWERISASAEDRPLGRTREQAEELYRARWPVYQQATIRVPVHTHERIESIVVRVEENLNNRGLKVST